jgi:ubiquinone/menaquinone biosynthesis C-methylase UbiE
MKQKNKVLFVFVLTYSIIFGGLLQAQQKPDVLAPDNANEARLNRLQPPDQVMDAIGVKPGWVVAEIGAGRGRYVVQLAVRVGENGKVYAEDIDSGSLRYLESRCERGGLNNVETIVGSVTDPKLPEGELDLIFIISSYHHFADPIALLHNARPALKPTGIVSIGEWLPTEDNKSEYRTPEKIEAEMKEAGYKLERIEKFLEKNNLYIYIFSPDKLR